MSIWKFEGVKTIYYYGFPDGDYAVYREYKRGKPTGREITPMAYRHYTEGSDTLNALGIKTQEDYRKFAGKLRAYIYYDEIENTTNIGIQRPNTKLKDKDFVWAKYEGNLLEESEETDWDMALAKRLSH